MAKSRSEFQRALDGDITTEFNNDTDVQKMLATLISDFMTLIRTSRSLNNNVKFFVKGGTSTKLLGRNYDPNWSDWDTQLIINPNLPIGEWYALFDQLIGALNVQLIKAQSEWEKGYKAVFDSLALSDDNGNYNLTIADQSQIISTLYTRSVHPAQVFDNVNTIYQHVVEDQLGVYIERDNPFTPITQKYKTIKKTDITLDRWNKFIKEHWIVHISDDLALITVSEDSELKINGDRLFDDIFNDAALQLINEKAQNLQNFKKSSNLINTVIKDFYLFRVIVKYELKGYKEDGTPGNPNDVVSFRGELLDISIPRHDSEESINQWASVNIQPVKFEEKSILVPDWEYQLKENITLIIEVLEGTTNSAHKVKKRITRGINALNILTQQLKNEKHTTDWAVVRNGLRIYQELNNRNYAQEITSINNYSGTHDHINLLLLWILYSIEKDYNLSYYFSLFSTDKQSFKAIFSSIENQITDQLTDVDLTSAGTDLASLNLNEQEKQFLNVVSFSTRLFKENKNGDSNKKINWRTVSDLVKQIGIKHKICLDAVGSSLLILKNHDNNNFYPYIELITPHDVETMKTALGSNRVFNALDDQGIIVQDGNNLPVLISCKVAFREDETETRNGYLMLKHNKIISRLNEKIALANSYYLLHDLDGLKNAYRKAITTF